MATPTEEQLLILNSIIYTDDFMLNGQNQSVYDWANSFDVGSIDEDNKPGEMSQAEFQNILDTIEKNPDVYKDMMINDVTTEFAGSYEDDNENTITQYSTNATITYGNELIIVYKGTGGDTEWRDNGEGGYSNVTDTALQQAALTYYDNMKEIHGGNKNIYVTGHSKGGNKAQYVGVLRGGNDELKHVYAFDGQGFGQAFLKKYQNLINKNKGKITNISNEYDFVNILLFPIAGNRKYIRSTTTWGIDNGSSSGIDKAFLHKFGGWHSPYSMFTTDKNGQLKLNDVVGQSELMEQVHGLFKYYAQYMREEDWRYLCYTIMSAMQKGKIPYGDDYSEMPDGFFDRLLALTKGYTDKTQGVDGQDIFQFIIELFGVNKLSLLTGTLAGIGYSFIDGEGYTDMVRDFSQTTKDQLLALIEEVENEPWYDVSKWDVWYRIDKYLLGGVDFPANGEELTSYYKKIIDMQGTGSEEIRRIFTDVYDTEMDFNVKMEARKNEADEILLLLKEVSGNFS
ncbi:Mbeg1-like protein [uncultured Enterococcus sp.]|uniref:Mbeg1-like protein n=1 Tax=uncultured Enterococcus sp. TaxID=167972 RepID=UPI002AA6A394|nr:Mbeg1-like protein [uncultured Enterococcus sp.]